VTISDLSLAPVSTFPAVLAALLRTDAARPLVTFYDDATGERVELSVATYANWVAKTAALVQDELDLERGAVVLLDLPTHWLGPVWLGAAWSLGLVVTDDATRVADADLVVCGPEGVEGYAAAAVRGTVVAVSLRPLGGPFTEPLPADVVDYGAVVLGQPDVFVAFDPPLADDRAWRDGSGAATQGELLAEASRSTVVTRGGRLLTDVNPCTRAGLDTLLAALVQGASTVWVRHPDETAWSARAEQERAGDQLRA
jgi:uncharacterized protein (TIGR03089 family)